MNSIKYILRGLASIPLSMIIAMAINYVASVTMFAALTLLPQIFGNILNFTAGEVAQNVMYNELLPGLGSMCSIINRPDFSARTTAFIFAILLFIALAIIAFIVYLLSKVTKDNLMSIISAYTVFGIGLILFGLEVFTGGIFVSFGIDLDFWYYLTATIMVVVLLYAYFMAAGYLWEEKDKYKLSDNY